jgi:hypothetical protein
VVATKESPLLDIVLLPSFLIGLLLLLGQLTKTVKTRIMMMMLPLAEGVLRVLMSRRG